MKKKFFISLLSCIYILFLSTLLSGAFDFNVNLMGGLNVGIQRNPPDAADFYNLPNPGFIIGGGVEAEFYPIAVEVDLMYEKRGYILYYFKDLNNNFYFANRFNYITIPILVKWVKKYRRNSISYGLGPSIGLLQSCELTLPLDLSGRSVTVKYDLTDVEKKTEFGLLGSLGVTLNNFILEARITYGLSTAVEGITSKDICTSIMAGLKL